MKNWVKFLLPTAIILAGILAGQKVVQNKQNKSTISAYLTTVAGISKDAIDGFVISDGKGALSFNKQNGIWKLEGKKADQEKISNIISILLDTDGTNYDLISQNPSRFDDLNVSSASANISLRSGGTEKLTIVVGSAVYPGNFIRSAKENNVYLTTKSLGNISTADRQSYLDKSILSLTSNKIQKIYVDNTKEKYALTKADNKWKIENSAKEVDEGKLSGLLTNLENLRADKVVEDPAEKNNYKQNYGSLKVETNDGKSETLGASKGRTDFMLARKSDGQLFTVSKATVETILKPTNDLLK